jgi:hypothetical protein
LTRGAARNSGRRKIHLVFTSVETIQSAGRGFWRDVPDNDWNDWRWQMKHRITTVEQLQKFLPTLTPEELRRRQAGQPQAGARASRRIFST